MPSIELKSISGKGIKSLILFQKPSLYAVISLTNVNQPTKNKTKKKTTVDKTNGENPDWDQPIRIDIDSGLNQDLILEFDLKAEALLGDRVVGRAFIPVADLDFSGAVNHASYQVKTPEGKANGAINFSYKVDGVDGPAAAVVPGPTIAMDHSSPEQSFYTAPSAPPQPEAASGFYPAVDPVVAYPPPGMAASGIYPPPDATIAYPPPPPQSSAGYYPKLEPGASYPPLAPDGGYPPQAEYCCREIPQPVPNVGGYYPPPAYPPQPECCCREIPQPAPAWYYPSAQHPAPGSYYPPPPPDVYGYRAPGSYYPPPPPPQDVYGYRQQGWNGYS